MKSSLVFVLALVALSSASPFGFPKRVVRSVSQETLDLAFDSIVEIYRTVERTYPAELVQEIVHEILENDGAFNFTPELRAKLDEKRVELKQNLMDAQEQIITGGEDLPEVILEKIRLYLDYSVGTLLDLTPFQLMEEITKEVLKNGGSFAFSDEILVLLEESKVAYKDGMKRLLDYEFEVFEDLIELDDDLRQKIYVAVEYMIDRTYDAIPWELLEDTVYYILENDGSVQLSEELVERIEANKDELREKLRDALDYVDDLLNGKFDPEPL